jgi:hypothetical protein
MSPELQLRLQLRNSGTPNSGTPGTPNSGNSEEWTSGDKAWLLDVIAPSQKLASAVLANFSQVVKEGDVRIHPVVARMVDPELLKKMGAAGGVDRQKA